MSPGVTNFVHDLVAMAQAMDELPRVKDALAEAQDVIGTQERTIGNREERILNLKAEIETLNQRIHKLTEDKDNAEFRFLELSEAFGPVASAAGALLAGVGKMNEVISPTPKREAQLAPIQDAQSGDEWLKAHPHMPAGDMAQPEGQSEANPTVVTHSGDANSFETAQNEPAKSSADAAPMAEKHHDPLPPSATTEAQSPDASQPAEATTNASESGGGEGKYAGKRYVDMAGPYIPLRDWLAEGGTEENYWRGRSAF